MFDTKIYHPFGCDCLNCHRIGCICDFHLGRVGVCEHIEIARQKVIEQNIYNKGFYDGRKEAYEEFEKEKLLFKSYSDQERMVAILKDLIKKIEK